MPGRQRIRPGTTAAARCCRAFPGGAPTYPAQPPQSLLADPVAYNAQAAFKFRDCGQSPSPLPAGLGSTPQLRL